MLTLFSFYLRITKFGLFDDFQCSCARIDLYSDYSQCIGILVGMISESLACKETIVNLLGMEVHIKVVFVY